MTQTCPYLGLIDDPNTSANFPSSINACHAVKPPFVVDLDYQRSRCLRETHQDCPGFITGWEGGVPKTIRQSNKFVSKTIPKKFIWIPLAAVLVAILIIGFTGLIPGFSFPFINSKEQESEPIIPTRTITPTTLSTLTPTPQPSSNLNQLSTTVEGTILISDSSTLTETITPTPTSTATETINPTPTPTLLPWYTLTPTSTFTQRFFQNYTPSKSLETKQSSTKPNLTYTITITRTLTPRIPSPSYTVMKSTQPLETQITKMTNTPSPTIIPSPSYTVVYSTVTFIATYFTPLPQSTSTIQPSPTDTPSPTTTITESISVSP